MDNKLHAVLLNNLGGASALRNGAGSQQELLLSSSLRQTETQSSGRAPQMMTCIGYGEGFCGIRLSVNRRVKPCLVANLRAPSAWPGLQGCQPPSTLRELPDGL